ncbi:hypothetical protein POM88_017906 [Heracleum sosnowskyi]|uniref:F-box associated domain-containing protein n=1 Tax=Heracleum sosnowskyi TaxID=360622 RepID=A0AAD8IRJ8_9APIA|nr:hypothetical protein POM88_017906 [Heracleum sosnowskyi]
METDVICEILLPSPYTEENGNSVVLVENSIFSEMLSLFYYDRPTYVLHIWVLENAGEPSEVWTKMTSCNFEPSWRSMGFRNNGEMVLRGGGKFLSYDLEKNMVKDIVDDDSPDVFYIYGETYPYPHQVMNSVINHWSKLGTSLFVYVFKLRILQSRSVNAA